MLTEELLSDERKLLIGAYFTQEYSLESAALFSPSMVWYPDHLNLPKGIGRFILSLCATGEVHISSITFRTGVIDKDNKIIISKSTRYMSTSENITNPVYEKILFERKLIELDLLNDFAKKVYNSLKDNFIITDYSRILVFLKIFYTEYSIKRI